MATITALPAGGTWGAAGTWDTGAVPTAADDVVLAATSGNVTLSSAASARSLDASAYTGTMTFTSGTGSLTLAASQTGTNGAGFILKLSTSMTLAGAPVWGFNSAASTTTLDVDFAGKTSTNVTFNLGKYRLASDITASGACSFFGGTLNMNGKTWNVGTGGTGVFTTSGTVARQLDFSAGGTINLAATNSATQWVASGSGFTTVGDTGVICFSTVSTLTRAFSGGGFSYPILRYTVAGSTGELDIAGSSSFAGIEVSDASNARSLVFTQSTTTTIRTASGWKVNGAAGKLLTVNTGPSGTSTISCASGNIVSDYLSLSHSIATGGATFYAGANSTNGGTNTGWVFTGPPGGRGFLTLLGVG